MSNTVASTRTPAGITTDALPDSQLLSFCVTDNKGIITSASAEFSTVTGYPLKEIIGRNCNFLQGPKTRPDVVALMREAVRRGDHISEHVVANYTKDGRFFWNFVRIVPLHSVPDGASTSGGAGKATHFVGFQRTVGYDPADEPDEEELTQLDILGSHLYGRIRITRLKQDEHVAHLDLNSGELFTSPRVEAASAGTSVVVSGDVAAGPGAELGESVVTYAGQDVLLINFEKVADGAAPAGDSPASQATPSISHSVSSQPQRRNEASPAIDSALVNPRLVLGVSSCLLGEKVRFNGQGARDSFVVDVLGGFVSQWVAVCPEVGIGLPTPRPTIRLVRHPDDPHPMGVEPPSPPPRLICPTTGEDFTERMEAWAHAKCDELATKCLSGFVFKSASPSSGLKHVKVYTKAEFGSPGVKNGVGVFARIFVERFPLVPVEEEGRLSDLKLRENFVSRVFVFAELRTLCSLTPTVAALRRFHSRLYLTVLLHDAAQAPRFEALLRDGGVDDDIVQTRLVHRYAALLMKTLAQVPNERAHVRVMRRVIDEAIADSLTPRDRRELLELLRTYREGDIPLIVPRTLLSHHVNRSVAPAWVRKQAYLEPSPRALRFHTSSGEQYAQRNTPRVRTAAGAGCAGCESNGCGHAADMNW